MKKLLLFFIIIVSLSGCYLTQEAQRYQPRYASTPYRITPKPPYPSKRNPRTYIDRDYVNYYYFNLLLSLWSNPNQDRHYRHY